MNIPLGTSPSIGLGTALDIEIWQYAYDHNYMIVTKDVDFSELGLIKGFPPKVIWIRRGIVRPKRLRPSYEKVTLQSAH